jgi:hypothetical protein
MWTQNRSVTGITGLFEPCISTSGVSRPVVELFAATVSLGQWPRDEQVCGPGQAFGLSLSVGTHLLVLFQRVFTRQTTAREK